MALSVIGFGTPSGSAGDATPTKHASTASGDLLLLAVEANGNQNPASITGYTLVDSSSGTGAGSTGLSVWRRVSDGTASDNPTIADVGNHLYAVIMTIRGQDGTTPINASADTREEVVDTSGTSPGLTTTVDGCLVIDFVATALDSTTPAWSTWANASLDSYQSTSQFQGGTDAGGGGGLGISYGTDTSAGTVNGTTMTTPNEHKAFVMVAVAPADEGGTDATVNMPAAGTLALTSDAPTFTISSSVTQPAAGTLALTAGEATLNLSTTVTQPASGILVLTASEPSLRAGVDVTQPQAGILRLTADAPTLTGANAARRKFVSAVGWYAIRKKIGA